MKTNITKYCFKNFASLTHYKVQSGTLTSWRQSIYILAFLLFSFSLSAQQDPVSVSSDGSKEPTTYGTLKLAADAVNNGIHLGIINISITGNTTETASIIFNASGTGASNYSSINIRPAGGGARSISGSLAAPLLDLNGADNITIDGLNTGGNSLTISNTSATSNTCTIRYLLDASYNTIQNCIITGSGTSSNYGTILFSTGSSTGNSNNIITGNNISSVGTSLALNAIYSMGTSANPNANVTVSNNNIYNYLSKGIDIGQSGSAKWLISGNSFYKEANIYDNYNGISIFPVYAIRILGGTGHTISNNYIGGEGSHLSGNNATYNFTGSLSFIGIMVTTGDGPSTSTIKGNIISKINISAVSASGSFNFYGIETIGSRIIVGGTGSGEGNIIGSGTANGSIAITTSTSGQGNCSVFGIYFHSNGGLILNNQVGGIDMNNVGSSPVSTDFEGIKVSLAGTPPTQVNNNIIGSTTTAQSIRMMATSTSTAPIIMGIYLGSSITSPLQEVNGNIIQNISNLNAVSSGTFMGINGANGYIQSFQNNTIKNIYAAANSSPNSLTYTGILSSTSEPANGRPSTIITNNVIDNINYQSSGSSAQIKGMEISGGSVLKEPNVSGNIISNLTTFSQKAAIANTDDPNLFTIIGILFKAGGASSVISNNNFFNFSSLTPATTKTTVNTVIAGLGISSTGGGNIYGNRISGFTNSNTGSANLPGIIGINAFNGTFKAYNNSIRFNNASLGNGVNIYGILQNTSGTTWNYFHNSVSISGSAPTGNAARTAAFIRTTEGGLLLKNNVFVNTRTGTGTHYAISNAVASPANTWLSSSSDYNNLYSSNTSTIAEWGSGVNNSFAQLQSSSGGEATSINRPVSFITSDYDLQPDVNLNCALNNAGIPITTPVVINTDLNAVSRSTSAPDLGAYEYTYIAPVDVASNNGPACIGANVTMGVTTGNGVSPFTYAWTGPNSFASASQNPVISNVMATMAGIYSVTVTDANGCSVNAQTTLTINAIPAGTLSSNVGNTVTTGSPVIFTATDGISYNFKVNGNSLQSGASATYTSGSLKTGDIITVTVGNSGGCSTTYTGITMTVSGIKVNGKNYIKWNGTKIKKWNGVKKVS